MISCDTGPRKLMPSYADMSSLAHFLELGHVYILHPIEEGNASSLGLSYELVYMLFCFNLDCSS